MSKMKLASGKSLEKCISILTTPRGAEYFEERVIEMLTKAKMIDKFHDLVEDVKVLTQSIVSDGSNTSAWSGSTGLDTTSFERYQKVLAERFVQQFKDREIVFDFALSDQAEILRGYTVDGEPISDEESKELDRLYNAWLAEKGMVTYKGVIYDSTSEGKIKQEKGQNKRANAEKLRDLIRDKKEGLSTFIDSKNMVVREQQHPADAQKQAGKQVPR